MQRQIRTRIETVSTQSCCNLTAPSVSSSCSVCDCVWLGLQQADGNEEQEWDWIIRGPGSGNKRGPLHSFHTVKREIFQTQATIDGWAYFTPWSRLFQWCHCWNREGKENQQHCHLAVILCPDNWTPILASLHASHWKEGEGRQFRGFLNCDSRSSVDYHSLLIRKCLKHINVRKLPWRVKNKKLTCSLLKFTYFSPIHNHVHHIHKQLLPLSERKVFISSGFMLTLQLRSRSVGGSMCPSSRSSPPHRQHGAVFFCFFWSVVCRSVRRFLGDVTLCASASFRANTNKEKGRREGRTVSRFYITPV